MYASFLIYPPRTLSERFNRGPRPPASGTVFGSCQNKKVMEVTMMTFTLREDNL